MSEIGRGEVSHNGPEVAQVERWSQQSYTQAQLAGYDAAFRVKPKSASNNGGQYSGSSLDRAWDEDWSSHWETGRPNNDNHKNYVEFVFEKPEELGRIIYGARSDAGNKGFAKRFEIWGADESGKELTLVATGSQATTGDLVEISFASRAFRVLRFVWVEAQADWASARCLFFYREDTLPDQVMGLFTDSAATALAAGVNADMVAALREKVRSYPMPEKLLPYLDMADKQLSGGGVEDDQAPMTLSQRGNRGSEASRTATAMTLGTFDLSGYYARPGEKLGVYVNADPKGPMPRIVLATVAQDPWKWAFDVDGKALSNGYNLIEVPENMASCQAIYFYNPALPDQQAFPPTVRLVGGTKYPVYRYDASDSVEVTKAKEADFIRELEEYVKGVTDVSNAQAGRGNYNMCEFVSDKYLSSTSARGALKGIKTTATWNKGDWREAVDTTKYGVVQRDGNGQPTGITFTGPAATMECFEIFYDSLSLYSGFNMDNPASEDYRNQNQFIFRAYTNGAGAGWGQSVFAGLNTGDQPDGNKWDGGDYAGMASASSVLGAGWLLYHEIGHVFDNGIIGTSESTNNLFALMGQDKFQDVNRLEAENRWYNHFTNYINTGLLPQDDLLFYPGAVVYQLDAVDFSKTKLYPEEGISNYGLACRYARLHRNEMNGLSKNDKLVLSISMGCGVDLSPHFEFYGRTVSAEVKQLLAGLPKESRPTWFVNDRTFKGGAFSEVDRAKTPSVTSHQVNESNGAVTLNIDPGVFTEVNLQCFAIYRQELKDGTAVGQPEFIGITGDDKSTKNINELYQFTDRNVLPGKNYRYTVSAYDCTLLENTAKATVDVQISSGATIPVQKLLINNGDEGHTISVGKTYALQVKYYPENATVDLNAVQWSVEGWGRDPQQTGSGPDTILMTEDPNYPGDPTRRLITGIAGGQTHVKVKLGNMTQSCRIVTNGTIKLEPELYELSFPVQQLTLEQGSTYELALRRTTLADNQTVNMVRFPAESQWISSNPAVATVGTRDNATVLSAHAAGTTTLTYSYKGVERATCKVAVTAEGVPLTGLMITGAGEVAVGKSEPLNYQCLPTGTTETKAPEWTSDNPAVARVNASGVVTGVSTGSAVITATIGTVSATKEIKVPDYKSLKGITVTPKTVTLDENSKTARLTIEKEPADATAGTVAWKSSNPAVVTVDESGLITGIAAGSAVVTAYLDGKSASCSVTVAMVTPLEGLRFKGKGVNENITAALTVDSSQQLMVYPEPLLAGGLSPVSWSSSNSAVATIKEGFVVGVGAGEATITATVTQTMGGIAKNFSVSCAVTVKDNIRPLTGVGISRVAQGLVEGDSFTLSLNNRPTNANRAKDGTSPIGDDSWVSSNNAVATVNDQGRVTAVAEGEAVITGSRGGVEATCKVSVRSTAIPATGVTLDRSKVTLNGLQATAQLKAAIEPRNATVSVYWVSDNVNVVQVDRAGNLTPVGEGKAIITASASGQQAKCEVTVTVTKVPPVITTQPKSALSQSLGSTVTFSVEAKKGTGMELPGALTYAWYRAKSSTGEGELLTTGPSDLYIISNLKADDAGYYYCVVTDHGVSSTSDRARLTVSGGGGSGSGSTKPPAITPDVPTVKPQHPFTDVDGDAWYGSAVAFVYQRGLFTGVEDNRFQPNDTASRATLVTVLSRLASAGERDSAPPVTFLDVPQDAWYAQSLAWGIRAGVVQGVGDGYFAPDAPITREQLVTILWRHVGSPKTAGSLKKYLDADRVGDYAAEAICWATENNIICGNELGYLSPAGQATRAEVAVILTRFLGGKV